MSRSAWRPAGLRSHRLLAPFHNRPMPPAEPGTYVLLLRCSSTRAVRVGRLGTLRLRPGWYVAHSAPVVCGLASAITAIAPSGPTGTLTTCANIPVWNPYGTPVTCARNMFGQQGSLRCLGRRWCWRASGVRIADAPRTCTGSGSCPQRLLEAKSQPVGAALTLACAGQRQRSSASLCPQAE
jgi:hypothetical protein